MRSSNPRQAIVFASALAVIGCGDDGSSGKGTTQTQRSSAGRGGSSAHAGSGGTQRASGAAGAADATRNGSGGAAVVVGVGAGAAGGAVGASALGHRIAGSVTAGVSGVLLSLTGAAEKTTVADTRGSYDFPYVADGDYVVTPSLFGYVFLPPSRNVHVRGADVIGQGFAATMNDAACPSGFSASERYLSTAVFSDVASGDFDGDRKLDLAAALDSSSISLLRGNGDGTLESAGDVTTPDGARYVAVADIDADGKLDLVVTCHHQNTDPTGPSQAITVGVLLGHGDGSFDSAVEYKVAATARALRAATSTVTAISIWRWR